MKMSRKLMVAMVTVATVVALSACSNGSDAGGDSTGERSPAAQAALDRAYEGLGSDLSDLPSVPNTVHRNLYVVSCGEVLPSCSGPAASVRAAGEAAGWTSSVVDGKLTPDGFVAAIRQAVAAGANVIIPIGIGCGVAQAAFKEAVDAGVTIVGGGGVDDCEPKLWGSERLWLPDYTSQKQYEKVGALQADYVYGKSNGDVKAVVMNLTAQVWGPWITEGFTAELASLGGGEVVETIDVSATENADGSYVQKVTTGLLSHPEANALIVPVDALLTGGLATSIQSAGLADKLLTIGFVGDEAALDMIRQGSSGLTATIGLATEWGAWGSVDTALRVLAGQKPVYIGETMQAVDADHNMPASGSFAGSVDFRAAFKKAWGVG